MTAHHQGVKDILGLLTGGDIWEYETACADRRARYRRSADTVEETDVHVQAPVKTSYCVPTKALTFRWFFNLIEMVNLRLSLTGDFFKLVAASFLHWRSFWAGDDQAAVRSF